MITKLSKKHLINNKKAFYPIIILCSIITIFFTIFSTMLYSHQQVSQMTNEKTYGNWDGVIINATNNDAKQDFIEQSGSMYIFGTCQQLRVNYGAFDQDMFMLANLEILAGRLPEKDTEVICDIVTLYYLGYDMKSMPKEISFTLVNADKPITKQLVGIIKPYDTVWATSSSLKYPSIITTNKTDGQRNLFITSKESLKGKGYFINDKLSKTQPTNTESIFNAHYLIYQEYIEPHLLFCIGLFLIIFQAILIFNKTINPPLKRKQFFSTLLSIGATKKQIWLFFIYQALYITVFTTSIGVVLGVASSYCISSLLGQPLLLSIVFILYSILFSLLANIVSFSILAYRTIKTVWITVKRHFYNSTILCTLSMAICFSFLFYAIQNLAIHSSIYNNSVAMYDNRVSSENTISYVEPSPYLNISGFDDEALQVIKTLSNDSPLLSYTSIYHPYFTFKNMTKSPVLNAAIIPAANPDIHSYIEAMDSSLTILNPNDSEFETLLNGSSINIQDFINGDACILVLQRSQYSFDSTSVHTSYYLEDDRYPGIYEDSDALIENQIALHDSLTFKGENERLVDIEVQEIITKRNAQNEHLINTGIETVYQVYASTNFLKKLGAKEDVYTSVSIHANASTNPNVLSKQLERLSKQNYIFTNTADYSGLQVQQEKFFLAFYSLLTLLMIAVAFTSLYYFMIKKRNKYKKKPYLV